MDLLLLIANGVMLASVVLLSVIFIFSLFTTVYLVSTHKRWD